MRTNETHLYVLELEDDNYYVGITNRSLTERLQEHKDGNGAASAWTREHPVTHFNTLQRNVAYGKEAERWMTLLMMKLHGWQNVRGGGWTRRDLASKPNALDQYTVEDLATRVAAHTIAPRAVASVLRESGFR